MHRHIKTLRLIFSLPWYSGGGQGWGPRLCGRRPRPNRPPEYQGRGMIHTRTLAAMAVTAILAIAFLARAQQSPAPPTTAPAPPAAAPNAPMQAVQVVPDPQAIGGETEGIVRVANLIYAGTKGSTCFSDHFLTRAEQDSTITTSRRLHVVKLADNELFEYPMVIMTGEGSFALLDIERQNLRKFIEGGGFLLASAGCSSPDWDRSFRSEMARIFPDHGMQEIPMTHPIFHTVYDITQLDGLHSTPRPLEGISIGSRLGVLYSVDGLNDTSHTSGCCCCGGNEITNDEQINVNILAYAMLY
jgi:Domain of unknown function (DUF4159)